MKFLLYAILLLVVLYNLNLSSILVRNGEVNFFNDVARDFLLLQELDHKKIVLIGPRSSTNNLFHGPIWTYINYPAYVFGNGDPVIVAWFWVGLGIVFLISSFLMVKKLFGVFPAFAFILLTSIQMALHINGLFHSEATFFLIPTLFFTICMYVKNKKKLFLILHLLTLSMLIQLEIGVGLQFLILSSLIIVFFIYKHKLWKHLLTFSLIPIFLSNLIIFDLKNEFRMTKAIFSTGGSLKFFMPFESWLENRINNTVSLQLFNNSPNSIFVYVVFVLVVFTTILLIKNKSKYRNIYFLFLFYYFGYMCLSFFNKGTLLFHYVYLLTPLTTFWLASFLATKYKLLFLPIIVIIFMSSLNFTRVHIQQRLDSFVGKDYNSWKSLTNVAQEVIIKEKNKEFGYFVFAPDALAYQPRYAMIYNFKKAHAKAFEYTKKPTTYIIAAPPPKNDAYMTHVWWRKVPVGISSEPAQTKEFPSGFIIEKFELTPDQQKIPHDKSIELGIHFR